MIGVNLVISTGSSEYAEFADTFKNRVLAMSGGVIDNYNCLLNDYYNNSYVDEALDSSFYFKDRVLAISGSIIEDFNCVLADFNAYY